MKKIDLHIHTVSSISDFDFEFSLLKLKEYVEELDLDCIAITNHNLFDIEQFREIDKALETKVLPGIEIDLENGHILLISENEELEDFDHKCSKVKNQNRTPTDYLTLDEFKEIFGDLRRYLLIPHYDKKPVIKKEVIDELEEHISAGEVASPKKFKYCIKNDDLLVPVLFSDLRFHTEMKSFSPRQTFIDIDDTSLRAIKTCLLDKGKVFLSKNEGHKFFQVFENGQEISNGLNVILGERSSGKSYTLKRICKNFENIKYIKQFELLETDEEEDKKKFNKILTSKQNSVSEEYLKEFKAVLEEVVKIDRKENEREIDKYVDSLLKVASEEEKKDSYSNCVLFNESKYTESNHENLKTIIDSTEVLLENIEYKEIIEQHIEKDSLINLILELMKKYNQLEELNVCGPPTTSSNLG